jgi:GT2 family glycosyltransferase
MTAVPPRASLLLLAYNQAATVQEAALACLAQDCEPLEIVFSDDASGDDTFAILQDVAARYHGPHRVQVRRNERNLGIGAHYNALMEVASGELLITAAGDDVSLRQRVARLLLAWDATQGRADLVASHVFDVDDQGRARGVLRIDDLSRWRSVADWARQRPYIIGAGHAFTRRMMQRFGPLHPGLAYEDQIMVFRAIAAGGAVTVDEPLVQYRRGGTSGRQRFDSPAEMLAWEQRRRDRERTEAEQLMSDAATVGCESLVRQALQFTVLRRDTLDRLHAVRSLAARVTVLRGAAGLPWGWRLKKLLRASWPSLAWRIAGVASALRSLRH